MITVESLTKKYGGFTAVDDISFMAGPGRVTGFLGPNGAGKSTTLRVMVGLTAPTSGGAAISGQRFADLPNPGTKVGVLLDASAQHAGRTGREILSVARHTMGLPAARVPEMLDLVGLSEADARAVLNATSDATRPTPAASDSWMNCRRDRRPAAASCLIVTRSIPFPFSHPLSSGPRCSRPAPASPATIDSTA